MRTRTSPTPQCNTSPGLALPRRRKRTLLTPRCGGFFIPHRNAVCYTNGNLGKPAFPIPPPGGRVWAGYARAQEDGETGFLPPPARGRVWAGYARAQEDGETGFLPPPACGRVWARYARAQEDGETGFLPPPACGRVWAGYARAQRVWGNRVSPYPHPVGGFGRVQPSQELCSSRRCAAQPHGGSNESQAAAFRRARGYAGRLRLPAPLYPPYMSWHEEPGRRGYALNLCRTSTAGGNVQRPER